MARPCSSCTASCGLILVSSGSCSGPLTDEGGPTGIGGVAGAGFTAWEPRMGSKVGKPGSGEANGLPPTLRRLLWRAPSAGPAHTAPVSASWTSDHCVQWRSAVRLQNQYSTRIWNTLWGFMCMDVLPYVGKSAFANVFD